MYYLKIKINAKNNGSTLESRDTVFKNSVFILDFWCVDLFVTMDFVLTLIFLKKIAIKYVLFIEFFWAPLVMNTIWSLTSW